MVALEVLPDPQEVGPVAVIPQEIIKKQVEQLECRRRDRPANRQAASSSDAPTHGQASPGRSTSAGACA